LTSNFNAATDLESTFTATVVINGLTVSQTLSFVTKADIQASDDLNPNSASPTLRTRITITLDPTFAPTLTDPADFDIKATRVDLLEGNEDYTVLLNVLSVNDAEKSLYTNFAGAFTGMYQVHIRHATYGLLDTTGMILDVSSRVLSVTPTTGSIYGGTLLTITGTNYGDAFTDNPVEITTQGIGNAKCYVQSIVNHDTITCRVDTEMSPKDASTEGAEVVVFLKTYEEAICEGTTCAWTYTDTLPEITAMTTEFDTDSM
jgi:hypothetical protein